MPEAGPGEVRTLRLQIRQDMPPLIQKRKQHYPVSPFLLQYLQHFGRRSDIPLVYDDLLRFSEAIPYENPDGEETLGGRPRSTGRGVDKDVDAVGAG